MISFFNELNLVISITLYIVSASLVVPEFRTILRLFTCSAATSKTTSDPSSKTTSDHSYQHLKQGDQQHQKNHYITHLRYLRL